MATRFKGLSAFPITPADEAGQVDTQAFSALIERLDAAEVDSIGILGSTGIYMYLSRAERRRAIEAAATAVGCPAQIALRRSGDGHAFVTDGGHWILDAKMDRIPNANLLAERLCRIPGVVEHGLFIGMAQAAILAGSEGVRVVERP